MSIAGGYFKAVKAAESVGCDCVQIFTKNNNQWRAKPITDDDVNKFREALQVSRIQHTLSHASYLINLASPNPELCEKSISAMVVELQRAEQLGIPDVVLHPGSFTTSDEATGIQRICDSIDEIHSRLPENRSRILLENTAGQGSNLGWQFEQLEKILNGVNDRSRLGVCIDTCHAFAAGYSLADPTDYSSTMESLDRHVGLDHVRAFHLNDSKQPFGSRKDRHENIGHGYLGLEPFRNLLNDSRFQSVPMYLETPKGKLELEDGKEGDDWDLINLRSLTQLVESS